jgi:hypothetical protein
MMPFSPNRGGGPFFLDREGRDCRWRDCAASAFSMRILTWPATRMWLQRAKIPSTITFTTESMNSGKFENAEELMEKSS